MRVQRVLVVVALVGMIANATAMPGGDGAISAASADVTALMQFYPTPLATSPIGAVEDKAVWLAKIQGLIATAPPLLRQSMLGSTTAQQFEANLSLLEQMQEGSLKRGTAALKSLAKSGKVAAKAADPKVGPDLGSGPADTVYTTLEPCRIMDSRNATVGSDVRGPLAGNQLFQLPGFIATGSNWGSYGGNVTSDCGLNATAGSNIWAVAIVITILNPNFDAFLGVGDVASLAATLSTVALNYTHGQGLSTMYVVPQTATGNIIYFAMPAQLSANIIFDVVGYFAVSKATALQCVTSNNLTFTQSGSFLNVAPASCAPGYTQTDVQCINVSQHPDVVFLGFGSVNNCGWYNGGGYPLASLVLYATTTCCRVPGR